MSECRWTGSEHKMTHDGSIIILCSPYCKQTNSQISYGVETHQLQTNQGKVASRYCKLTILQSYTPNNEAEEDDKDDWYEKLQRAVSKFPQHCTLLINGDLNAKVGNDKRRREDGMGQHDCRTISNDGERFVKFCVN